MITKTGTLVAEVKHDGKPGIEIWHDKGQYHLWWEIDDGRGDNYWEPGLSHPNLRAAMVEVGRAILVHCEGDFYE